MIDPARQKAAAARAAAKRREAKMYQRQADALIAQAETIEKTWCVSKSHLTSVGN